MQSRVAELCSLSFASKNYEKASNMYLYVEL